MENTLNTQGGNEAQPQQPAAQEKQPEKKSNDGEFSVAWHLKALAVIYVILGILYIVLKVTLK